MTAAQLLNRRLPMFISPMNCHKLPEEFTMEPGEWVAEEKYDGHRIVVQVFEGPGALGVADMFDEIRDTGVRAWSRYGRARVLPYQVSKAMARLPVGVYDGELFAPGKRAYGTKAKVNEHALIYVVFDVLSIVDIPTVLDRTWAERREVLEEAFKNSKSSAVSLSPVWPVNTMREVWDRRNEVWERDGEGLILKRRAGFYFPGKRSKDFLKVKKLQTALVTVIGFAPGRGQIVDRGPYAMVRLRDDEGYEFQVKTLNDAQLAAFETRGRSVKMSRRPKFVLQRVRFMPKELSPGVLYVSEEFGTAAHLCPCGCRSKVRTPLGPTEWTFTDSPAGPTLFPSVGNWQLECRSHYVVEEGDIIWCAPWTPQQKHPDLGRKLWIEYVEKTPDGAYWHPRWDRWEDE